MQAFSPSVLEPPLPVELAIDVHGLLCLHLPAWICKYLTLIHMHQQQPHQHQQQQQQTSCTTRQVDSKQTSACTGRTASAMNLAPSTQTLCGGKDCSGLQTLRKMPRRFWWSMKQAIMLYSQEPPTLSMYRTSTELRCIMSRRSLPCTQAPQLHRSQFAMRLQRHFHTHPWLPKVHSTGIKTFHMLRVRCSAATLSRATCCPVHKHGVPLLLLPTNHGKRRLLLT